MPIYEEKEKVNGKSKYYIRTYIKDENGVSRQIKRHNPNWIGRDGKLLAMQEENRLRTQGIETKKIKEEPKECYISLSELERLYLNFSSKNLDKDTIQTKKTRLDHFCQPDKTKQITTFPNKNISDGNDEWIKIYTNWQNEMKNKMYSRAVLSGELLYEWKKDSSKRKYKWFFYSIKQLNSIHSEICRMLDYGKENGYIKFNFAKQCGRIGTPKEIKFSQKPRNYNTINYEQYLKLMDATNDNERLNTLFDLWFSRGPRTGEIRAFKVKDYIPEKQQLMVNHTMSKKNELKPPKTASSKAPIVLGDRLDSKIHSLVEKLKKQPGFSDEWYLFGTKDMPVSSHALTNNKDKYFRIAKIDVQMRTYDFRHSCATWLYSIGKPITFISKVLRHKNIGETMKTYTHIFTDDYEMFLKELG